MHPDKRKRLTAAGWTVGSVQQFLNLSDLEAYLLDLRTALALQVRKRRIDAGLTQVSLAKHLGTSQSRLAKMEAADESISLDLLIRTLLMMGMTPREMGKTIGAV